MHGPALSAPRSGAVECVSVCIRPFARTRHMVHTLPTHDFWWTAETSGFARTGADLRGADSGQMLNGLQQRSWRVLCTRHRPCKHRAHAKRFSERSFVTQRETEPCGPVIRQLEWLLTRAQSYERINGLRSVNLLASKVRLDRHFSMERRSRRRCRSGGR